MLIEEILKMLLNAFGWPASPNLALFALA